MLFVYSDVQNIGVDLSIVMFAVEEILEKNDLEKNDFSVRNSFIL